MFFSVRAPHRFLACPPEGALRHRWLDHVARASAAALRHGLALAVIALSASLAAPARAVAQSIVLRRPGLHWVRSDDALGCVAPRRLAEEVEALVGPVLVRPSEAEYSIEGQVEVTRPGHLHVRVRVLDARGQQVGERQIEHDGSDCAALTPAIVFVIGMAIDPEVAAHGLPPALMAALGESDRPPEQTLLAELDQAPAVLASAVAQVREQPVVLPPRRPGHQAAVLLRGAYRDAPRATMSADARLLYMFGPPFGVAVYTRGGGQLGSTRFHGDHGLRVVEVDLGAMPCAAMAAERRLRLSGCLGGELSWVVGRGSGFNEKDQAQSVGRVGLVAQVTARVNVWRQFGVAVVLDGRLSNHGHALVFNDAEKKNTVYRFPVLSGGIALGPSWEF